MRSIGASAQQMAIRMGDYKLVRYDINADTLSGKRNQGVTAAKLYHLANNPGETKDLAAALPDKVKALQTKWDTWNTANVPPLWGGDPKDSDGNEPGPPVRRQNNAQVNP